MSGVELTPALVRHQLATVKDTGHTAADSCTALRVVTDARQSDTPVDVDDLNGLLVELVKATVTCVDVISGSRAPLLFILGESIERRLPHIDRVRLRRALIAQLIAVLHAAPAPAVSQLCGESAPVTVALIRLLATDGQHADGVNATECFTYFKSIGEHPLGTVSLVRQAVFVDNALSLLSTADVQGRLRVHEAIVNMVCASADDGVEAALAAGIVEPLALELDTCKGDVLATLNVLQLFADAASLKCRIASALHDWGVMSRLSSMLERVQSDVDGGFTFPGIMRFFGYIAAVRPAQVLADYPAFARAMFSLCLRHDHVDVTQRLLAFDTVAVVGGSPHGKDALATHGNEMRAVLSCWSRAARSGPNEVRARHLAAAADLFHLEVAEHTGERLATMLQWFDWMAVGNADFTDTIVAYWREPIPATRKAASALILALCVQPWAQHKLALCTQFVPLLTERGGTWDADGNRAKYDIVCRLCDSPTAAQHVGDAHMADLRLYRQRGPFYAAAQHQVAFDGQ